MAAKSRAQIEREIERTILVQARKEAELDKANEARANEIAAFIKSKTPVDTGGQAGSIQVKKVRRPKNGLPARVVFSDDPTYHMTEYGTKADPANTKEPRRVEIDGKWVTLGRDTPTQAVGAFAQARKKFDGVP